MIQNFDLNKMGLVPLSENELIQVDGEGFLGRAPKTSGD